METVTCTGRGLPPTWSTLATRYRAPVNGSPTITHVFYSRKGQIVFSVAHRAARLVTEHDVRRARSGRALREPRGWDDPARVHGSHAGRAAARGSPRPKRRHSREGRRDGRSPARRHRASAGSAGRWQWTLAAAGRPLRDELPRCSRHRLAAVLRASGGTVSDPRCDLPSCAECSSTRAGANAGARYWKPSRAANRRTKRGSPPEPPAA